MIYGKGDVRQKANLLHLYRYFRTDRLSSLFSDWKVLQHLCPPCWFVLMLLMKGGSLHQKATLNQINHKWWFGNRRIQRGGRTLSLSSQVSSRMLSRIYQSETWEQYALNRCQLWLFQRRSSCQSCQTMLPCNNTGRSGDKTDQLICGPRLQSHCTQVL